jgi:GNAT superfamily N-acetyltransferase
MSLDISTNKQQLNIPLIHNYLTQTYWAEGRSIEQVKTTIENSLCFGVYLNNEQIGFARVVTDHVTIAHICDVFILKEHNGKGFAKTLMKTIVDHPTLQGIKRWMLGTRDAHKLYEKFGFKPPMHPERWMERMSSM